MKTIIMIIAVIFIAACESAETKIDKPETDEQTTQRDKDNQQMQDKDSEQTKDDNIVQSDNSIVSDTETPDESNSVCGNGIIEAGEACDMDYKNCNNISDKYMPDNKVRCKNDCSGYEENECQLYCGNGVKDNNEVCELDAAIQCQGTGAGSFIDSSLIGKCSSACNGYDVTICVCMDQYKEEPVCVMLEQAKKECGIIFDPKNECWKTWKEKMSETYKNQ